MSINDRITSVFPNAPVAILNMTFEIFGIKTENEKACFVSQVGHESGGFTSMVENLNYSAKRLAQVFPNRFKDKTTGQPNSLANRIAHQPQLIANTLYNGRLGNAANSNDGWTYRGRGFLQITGRDNYTRISQFLFDHGLLVSPNELVDNPAIAGNLPFAAYTAGAFWKMNNLNQYCNDFRELTKRINGGYTGYEQRLKYYNRLLGRM